MNSYEKMVCIQEKQNVSFIGSPAHKKGYWKQSVQWECYYGNEYETFIGFMDDYGSWLPR